MKNQTHQNFLFVKIYFYKVDMARVLFHFKSSHGIPLA